jgi:hypothetical protein
LPRIGTVIRDVYRRPGADAVPAHLEDRYGIVIDKATKLAPGVYRVDRQDGPAWVARAHLTARPAERARDDAEVLRLLHHLPAYEGGPGQDLAAASALLAGGL